MILRRFGYPFLLLSAGSVVIAALHYGWDPGRVSPFVLIGTVLYLSLLERLIPYRTDWHPSPRELRWYGIYFGLTMIGGALSQALVSALVAAVAPPRPVLPLGAEIPLALLLGSLAGHLAHRWAHRSPRLWRLHGVHHVPQKVNVANNGVNHVLDVFLKQSMVQLTLALAGFSRQAEFVVGSFILVQGYFVHSNIDVRLGRLNHLLAGPELHRLHHSVELAEAGHYSADLSLWDHVFGSFTWWPDRVPEGVGLSDPASFPETGAILAGLLHPWRHSLRVGP